MCWEGSSSDTCMKILGREECPYGDVELMRLHHRRRFHFASALNPLWLYLPHSSCNKNLFHIAARAQHRVFEVKAARTKAVVGT